MADLTVQIGSFDDIAVYDANSPNPGASNILSGGAAEAAGTDDKYSGIN